MIYMDIQTEIEYSPLNAKTNPINIPDDDSDRIKKWKDIMRKINELLGNNCGYKKSMFIYAYNGKARKISFIAACELETIQKSLVYEKITSCLMEQFNLNSVKKTSSTEITLDKFTEALTEIDAKEYIEGFYLRNLVSNLKIDFFNNNQFKIKESLSKLEKLSKKQALKQAADIMASQTYLEEIERIYSPLNKKVFYGNPVHYKVLTGTKEAARDMIQLLVQALYSNNRLLGGRISYVYEVTEGCYDEDDLKNVFMSAQGSTIVIEMRGSSEEHSNYASCYEQVVEYLSDLIKIYQRNTLVIFLEIIDRPGFSKSMLNAIAEEIDIIELEEGAGTKDRASKYLNKLMSESDMKEFIPNDIESLLPSKESYRVTDVFKAYNQWFRNGLKSNVYCAYEKSKITVAKEQTVNGNAYEELKKMVGLSEVKEIVEQIIASFSIQKMKKDLGITYSKNSMHMIFTGNPGSAKTSVARLLANILREKEILPSGDFIECGRSDLVGRYVGWTAKEVRKKFRLAKGGILFIDEAYSLVDDSNSFGDEAINTIVQEMENQRDDTIVIFAGYPDKMKKFLEKNEGLKSRIAFHINFPDYSEDELLGILRLIADKNQYILNREVEEKCRLIFKNQCKGKDFGNGRFVRNLFEQAQMKQSQRLIQQKLCSEISREELMNFEVSDFDYINEKSDEGRSHQIGFVI